jgi:CRISPR system Cascade subunit CasD
MRWLTLNLEAPLSAFGGVIVDGIGGTRDHPALSAITGLLGSALGYDRTEPARLAALQGRLLLASAYRVGAGGRLTDFQTAQLGKDDRGWTRDGVEGRTGGPATYDSPILSYRDYVTDRRTVCVIGLKSDADPDLDAIAAALDRPEWPLFLGRKSCIPSVPIRGAFIEAGTALEALRIAVNGPGDWLVSLPDGQGDPDRARRSLLPDLRDWGSDLHAGARLVTEGRITVPEHNTHGGV